jgi:N-acylglucosamine-6-phosphate 2-epimerase
MTVAAATLAALRGGLVVSCQAPAGSPLHDAYVIARMALAAEQGGAAGLRIDGPDHIRAARALCAVPIIGLHKQVHVGSDVYITPSVASARGVVQAGATLVAVDGTARPRPGGESLAAVIEALRDVHAAVIADVSTTDEGLAALDLGVDALATTLSGYTAYTRAGDGPDLTLVSELSRRAHVPVLCEGRVRSAADVRRAFEAGAFAVVVGGAITGIDAHVRDFVTATPTAAPGGAHA